MAIMSNPENDSLRGWIIGVKKSVPQIPEYNTTAAYQEVLKHFVLPTVEQLFGGDEFTFQHDLAPTYNAKSTKTW